MKKVSIPVPCRFRNKATSHDPTHNTLNLNDIYHILSHGMVDDIVSFPDTTTNIETLGNTRSKELSSALLSKDTFARFDYTGTNERSLHYKSFINQYE